MRATALAITLVLITMLSEAAFSQPVLVSERVRDVTYDGQLYLSLANGTLVAYSDGMRVWKLTLDYGAPALLTRAPPHGILVLTDAGWLGLVTRDGRPKGWVKLNIDPSAITEGKGKLLYANGLALIYAGKMAVAVSVPELKPLGYFSIKNTFLGGSVSPRGDGIMLLGFDTLCSACIRNEEKLVLVIEPMEGEPLFRAVVNRLRDAAVLWNRKMLVLAKWDAMYVYDLEGGRLEKPVRVYTYVQPVDKWLSWGFSPSGSIFHYIFADETSLSIVVVDVETGSSVSRSLPMKFSKQVLSSLDDDCRMAIATSNADEAEVLVGDVTGVVRVEKASGLGALRAIKIVGDRAIVVFSNALLAVPFLPLDIAGREQQPLAYLMVKVVDREGRPFQEAFICANTSCAIASPTGTAAFVLKEGNYILTVKHPQAREFQVTVKVLGNVTRIVALERLYRLVVNVSSDKTDIKACTIRVYDANGGKVNEAASCAFALTLPKGSYTVEVQTPRRRITQLVAIEGDTVLHVAIPERATITVGAVDENGTPLHDAAIIVLDSSNATIATAQGRFSSELPAGRYSISVQRSGYLNWSLTLELNSSLSIEAQLTRMPQVTATDGKEFSGAQVIAASLASALATAGLVITASRINIAKRSGKRAPQASFKRRMGKR